MSMHCNSSNETPMPSGGEAHGRSKTKSKVSRVHFPWRLHQMLRECEANEEESRIVSWLPNGAAFKIHDRAEFAAKIMPRYFSSNKYRTFQRSMNVWGFQTTMRGPDRGSVQNPLFRRDRADLIHAMKRNNKVVEVQRRNDKDAQITAKPKTTPETISADVSVTSLSHQSPSSMQSTMASAPSSVAPSTSSSKPQLDFGTILYAMLDYGSASGVRWEPDGCGFRIVNASLHSDQFYEKLRLHNVTKDNDGVYRHDFLIRGQPQSCQRILPCVVASGLSNAGTPPSPPTIVATTFSAPPSPKPVDSPLVAALQVRTSSHRTLPSSPAMVPPLTSTSSSPLQQFLRRQTRPTLSAARPPAASKTVPIMQQQREMNFLQCPSIQPKQIGDDSTYILMAMMSILQERLN